MNHETYDLIESGAKDKWCFEERCSVVRDENFPESNPCTHFLMFRNGTLLTKPYSNARYKWPDSRMNLQQNLDDIFAANERKLLNEVHKVMFVMAQANEVFICSAEDVTKSNN